MAYPYQKHIWVTREIIRREYLQNIEDGIYDEQQERLQADAELAQDLADEVSRATNAEDALTTALQAESTRAQTAESAEATRAQSAESNLSNRISAEVTRATGVEESLSDDIDSLDERISNEYTRATNAESSLGTRVSTLEATATRAYKAAGSVLFADLPALTTSRQGNVYNIRDDFTTTSDFVEGAGKDYPAGTNVAIVALEGTPITYKYDVMSGFIDTSDFITNTDYATTTTPGIVKPDGVTTSIDANGVISATGGGSAVEKAYKTNDSASTTIDDTDYVPMSTSSETRKKALWSTIIAKIKAALGKSDVGLSNVANLDQSKAIKSITRSGTTFTATALDGTTSTFTQQDNDTKYNFSGTTFYSGNNGTAEHDANNMVKNGVYYYTSNGPATSIGASATDGAIYVQAYSDSWVAQIAQDYRNGNLFIRGKNNGSWTAWKSFRKPTGNATAAQVLSGYTFSNASSDGLSGSMPSRSNGTYVDSTGIDSVAPWAYIPYGYYPSYSSNRAYVYFTAAQVQNFHKHTATATPTGSSLNSTAYDLGEYHSYRYVNTAVCYTRGSQHYANNRSGYASANNASELRFDLYDIKPSTIIGIRTTDSTTSYITIKDGNNSVYVNSQVVDTNHSLSYTIPSSFTNGTICIYAHPTSGERNLWYWWTVSNSSY